MQPSIVLFHSIFVYLLVKVNTGYWKYITDVTVKDPKDHYLDYCIRLSRDLINVVMDIRQEKLFHG